MMYNGTIIEFGYCDIRNNQSPGKSNQPRLITLASTLIIPDITKTSSNYCLLLYIVLTISILIGQEPLAYFEFT